VRLDIGALALDAVPFAEEPMVMVGRRLKLCTGRRVGRLLGISRYHGNG
jgi:hypothetical protein